MISSITPGPILRPLALMSVGVRGLERGKSISATLLE